MLSKKSLSGLLSICLLAAFSFMSVFAATGDTLGSSDYGESSEIVINTNADDDSKYELNESTNGVRLQLRAAILKSLAAKFGVDKVQMAVSKLSEDHETVQAIKEKLENTDFTNVVVFNIDLKGIMADGSNINIENLGDKISVTIPIPDGMDVNTVLHYDDETGAITNYGGIVRNGYITFETDHLSTWALAKTEVSEEANGGTATQTGDNTNNTLIMILVVMSGVVLATALLSKKFSKDSEN